MARARPARLLNDAGLATTVREPATRCATCCLVDVLPNDPVIATTVGATWARRAWAAVTYGVTSRRSTGLSTADAASTTSGTAQAPRAATGSRVVHQDPEADHERLEHQPHQRQPAQPSGEDQRRRAPAHAEERWSDDDDGAPWPTTRAG